MLLPMKRGNGSMT